MGYCRYMFRICYVGVLLSFLVPGIKGSIQAKVRCDDIAIIYVDGVQQGVTTGYTDRWISMVPNDASLVAVDCENFSQGDPGGLLVWLANGVISDTTWKCSATNDTNWYGLGYDDSAWMNAYVVQDNPTSTTDRYWSEDTEFPRDAKWIWRDSDFRVEDHSYCRRWFSPTVPTTISSVEPLFGPKAGGTDLVIRLSGMELTQQPVVKVGDMDCLLQRWSANEVVARTPLLQNTSVIGLALDVSFSSSDGAYGVSEDVFTYREDPVISNVSLNEALAVGGIRLTVTGENLNSVSNPVLSIIQEIKDGGGLVEKEEYTSDCTEVTDPSMVCPTPVVDFPEEFQRGTDTGDRSLDFYLGFILDGVDRYTDLRESPVEELAPIVIIPQEPIIYKWDGVRNHEAGDSVDIQGEDLTAGATVHDYTVTVGSGVCTGLTLFQNALSCYPPTVEPVKEAATSRDGAHNVYVKVGKFEAYVGLLDYSGDDSSGNIGVIVGVVLTLLIVGIIVVVILLVLYRRKKSQKEAVEKEIKEMVEGDYLTTDSKPTKTTVVKKAPATSATASASGPTAGKRSDDDVVPAGEKSRQDDGKGDYLMPTDSEEGPPEKKPEGSYVEVE